MKTKVEAEVFTSGEVAAFCNVHFRTVIRWIEKGRLKAYKLPGRGNNRIERSDFLAFLKENNMPVPEALLSEKKKVLIVDDEVSMAKAIQRNLRTAGLETSLAHDGFQAGIQLANFKPDLMTLDLSMPKMDGFAVLEYIKEQIEFESVKILVVSALDKDQLSKALSLGADQAIPKPFTNPELIEAVGKLLSVPLEK